MIGEEIRRRRQEQGLTIPQLAAIAGMSPSSISQIETGKRSPHSVSVIKLAAALECEVADLYPEAASQLSLEDVPTLEELHNVAGCATSWLIRPEEDWAAAWGRDLTLREVLGIVREMAAELYALKPLMAEQERDPPWARRTLSGQYKQAWQRFFNGVQEAHARGVANGLITQEETLNDLEKKLGETPGVRYEEMLLAG